MDILFLVLGLILGAVIVFLFLRSKQAKGGDTAIQDAKLNELEKSKLVLETNLVNAEKEMLRLSNELRITREQHAEHSALEREKFLSDLNSEKEKVSKYESRIARAEEVFKSQEEKNTLLKTEIENIGKKNVLEFENIASKILEEKSKKFTDQNKTNLDIILNPLKEKIKDFEDKVEKAYKAESDERIVLKTEIKNLIELNKQVSEEANNLARALKGENKTQGNWGELILEKVLERSGLVKGQEYNMQFSTTNEDSKRIQPDAIILLPDNKHIIVDAKVSLVAYEALVNSSSDEERERLTKDHLLSVRTHIRSLSEKNYSTSPDLNTPDFVLLFIPIESSFSIAVQADQELFNFAWDKKIVIVSPSTLLATLRTIASVWKQERQTKNAIEIAKQSGALYDKFVGFLEDMDKIGKNMDQSKTMYDSAMNKLYKGTGNLVKRAQDIEKLGAKTTKQIPPKFSEPDELTQLTGEA
ncbi:MAG: DNA recombination protein RmuC [Bacteroidota bacterium]|nr:DNA recombination protein RmuC [Bacteroidota bacterium]